MNEAAKHIINVISNWKAKRTFTYETRSVIPTYSPVAKGEVLLKFTCILYGFYWEKNGEQLQISLTSQSFQTTTLYNPQIGINLKADKYRLEKFLDEFDAEFDKLVDAKLAECGNKSYTTDPLFW